MPKETAAEIDEAAAAWVARIDRGLTSSEEKALDAWLQGDLRRLGAFGRMRALALHTERAAALGGGSVVRIAPPSRPLSRRQLFGRGGAAAAVFVAAVTGGALKAHSRGRFVTRRGEVRVVPLADGSVMTLNTASQVVVRYSNAVRSIKLIEGEALFDVAKDPGRPFVVSAGDTVVRAIGTSFTVSRLGDTPVKVLVREGAVEVARARAPRAVRVSANMRAIAPAATVVATTAVPAAEVDREMVWREGRIAFEGETLAEAAVQFARYSDTRIVIEDPSLAQEAVTGLFQANDPVGFARAVAVAFGAQAEVGVGGVRLRQHAGPSEGRG